MGASFSKTAYDRLPAAVRKLEKDAQTVCIHLRLRKTPERIAAEMGLPAGETARLEDLVRRTLIAGGNYDIIADPRFVPIGEEGEEIAAGGADNEDRILARNFVLALQRAFTALAPAERRVLHLFFERRMTGHEILDLLRRADVPLGPGTPPENQADVFYLVEKALKKLLGALAETTPIGRGTLTVKGLKEVLYQTGVEAA